MKKQIDKMKIEKTTKNNLIASTPLH